MCRRPGLDGCRKFRPPPGFDHRTVQLVTSSYTNYIILVYLAAEDFSHYLSNPSELNVLRSIQPNFFFFFFYRNNCQLGTLFPQQQQSSVRKCQGVQPIRANPLASVHCLLQFRRHCLLIVYMIFVLRNCLP